MFAERSLEAEQRLVTTTYNRSIGLWGFDRLVEGMGGDPAALLREVGLPPDVCRRPDTLLNFGRIARLMEIVAQRLERPSFGLEWTEFLPPEMPNVEGVVLCAYFSSNLGEWAELGLRSWALQCNGYRAEFVETGDPGTLAMRNHVDPLILFPVRQLTEHAVANQVKLARCATGFLDENPTVVRFQHFKPKDTSVHERIFRCPVEFDQPYNEIVFDRKFVDYPLNGKLTVLRPLVNFYVKHRIRQLTSFDQRISSAIAQAIPAVMSTRNCKIEFIASSMGFSAKKLQRLLAAEGTSFSEVLDSTRKAMAQRYLLESNAPVSQIAGLLDYSSVPPFTLAFRRWTGTTPLAFRKQSRRKERTLVPKDNSESW